MSNNSTFNVTSVSSTRLDSANLDDPGFGELFSDHMLEVEYREGQWHQPEIKPFGSIDLTPALNTLHYGQSVFEGMKAYHADENTIHLFRPHKNYRRFVNSCERMCIPPVTQEVFLDGIKKLLKLDHRWVPQKGGNALYIRPFACAFDNMISARVSEAYRFYIITSPVGSYYNKPVKLSTTPKYARAVKGGVGEAKTAGNYAASLYPTQKAQEKGFDQVLWLDALEHKFVEEVGTMNIFFVIDGTLVTPELSGTILPGITRSSVLQLARKWGMPVEERRLSINEVMEAGANGKLDEAFGAGTAAVIAPVAEIHHNGQSVRFDFEQRGPVGEKMFNKITDIQWGNTEDPFDWITAVEVNEQ